MAQDDGDARRAQQERESSGPIIRPLVKVASPVGKIITPIRPVADGLRKPLPQIRVTTEEQRPPLIVPPVKRKGGEVPSTSPETLQPLLMALGAHALLGALGTSGNGTALAAVRPPAPKPQVSVRPLFSAREQKPAAPRLLRPKAPTGKPS